MRGAQARQALTLWWVCQQSVLQRDAAPPQNLCMQGDEDGCGLPTRISWRMNSISRDSGGSALITIDALLAAAANEGDDIAQPRRRVAWQGNSLCHAVSQPLEHLESVTPLIPIEVALRARLCSRSTRDLSPRVAAAKQQAEGDSPFTVGSTAGGARLVAVERKRRRRSFPASTQAGQAQAQAQGTGDKGDAAAQAAARRMLMLARLTEEEDKGWAGAAAGSSAGGLDGAERACCAPCVRPDDWRATILAYDALWCGCEMDDC